MKRFFALSCLLSMCILAGCGSSTRSAMSGVPTPGTPASPHPYGVTARGGSSMFVPSPGSAVPAVLENVAMFIARPAVSTAPSGISMSFNGYCAGGATNSLSNIFWGATGNTAPVRPPNVLLGMGASNTQQPQGCLGPNGGAFPPTIGAPVVGDGTLSILRVYLDQPLNDPAGLPVWIYVNAKATVLTCVVPNGGTYCADNTDSATVNDNDRVVAGFAAQSQTGANSIYNLQVILGKS